MFVFAEPIINLTRACNNFMDQRSKTMRQGAAHPFRLKRTSFQASPIADLHDKKLQLCFRRPSVQHVDQLCRQDGSVRGFRTCTFRTAPTSISSMLKKKGKTSLQCHNVLGSKWALRICYEYGPSKMHQSCEYSLLRIWYNLIIWLF